MKKRILKINPKNVDNVVSKMTINKVSSFIGQYKKSIINLGYDQKTIKSINRTQRYFLSFDNVRDFKKKSVQKTLKNKINELQFLKGVERVYNVDDDTIDFEFKYTTKEKRKKLSRFDKVGDFSKEAINNYYQKIKGDSPLSLQYLLNDLDFSSFSKDMSTKKIDFYEKKIGREKNKLLQIAIKKGLK